MKYQIRSKVKALSIGLLFVLVAFITITTSVSNKPNDVELLSLHSQIVIAQGESNGGSVNCRCTFWGKCKASGSGNTCSTSEICYNFHKNCGMFH